MGRGVGGVSAAEGRSLSNAMEKPDQKMTDRRGFEVPEDLMPNQP
jgi:hypothetical protein